MDVHHLHVQIYNLRIQLHYSSTLRHTYTTTSQPSTPPNQPTQHNTTMASNGNRIEAWDPNPFTAPPNANVSNSQTMTSPQAQAARAKSEKVMEALRNGDTEEANRLIGKQENYDSLVPGE
ncbi:hypothetical protein D6C91_06267 [Aureobasidium pullulans]|uniref:Uncharacterized protein n=1 Tax=Aureobasidium pullulans TaxID=5580 RepID=A0A4S9SXK4_AURPU|nr:hypothetical protein D6C91_06267 [Aureobasidium pullulans]